MAKKLYGTDPDQVPTNADLGTTAYTNVQGMPNVVIGEAQEGIRFIDPSDKYAFRINGADYYSSGMKLSRTGTHGYTGTLMFEKIKTDADGAAVDAKTNDRVMQLYASVSNNEGAYCAAASIVAELTEDAADQTTVAGRIHFQPDGDNVDRVSIDVDGIKFNGDTATANALSDYEEGTFSPLLSDGTNTVALGTGKYTRIGRHISYYIQAYNVTISSLSASAHLRITGFPYTFQTSNPVYANSLFSQREPEVSGIAENGGTTMLLYKGENNNVDYGLFTRNVWNTATTATFRGQFMANVD
jgi:hypothetical protein